MTESDCCGTTGFLVIMSVLGLGYLIKKYTSGGTYHGIETMAGKTVVITGANTGVGKETVRELAMRGARVIMGCRDEAKGKEALQEIVAQTNSKNVELRKLDLASFASIRAFVNSVLETESRIDVLINNAGVMMCPKSLTEDGLELQIGVNHFGHFLLTNLLLDRIKESAPSRIVIVSSIAQAFGEMNFDDLHSEKSYHRMTAYSQSKLANVLHALELSKRLQGTGVTVNSLHPGAVDTDLARHVTYNNSNLVHGLFYPMKYFTFKSPKQGAQTSLRLAIDPKLENVTGKYFSDCKEKLASVNARDEAAAKRLWEISEDTTKKND